MIFAEIRNKLNYVDFPTDQSQTVTSLFDITRMEDVLTSNVFGILKNIDYSVLNRILQKANIPELNEAPEFHFWHSYSDGTEPDLIIENTERYIVVEVKYLSDFDKGRKDKKPQILREIEGGLSEAKGKKFDYLAITNEDNVNWDMKIFNMNEYNEVLKSNRNCLHHISWHEIYKCMKKSINDNIDIVSKHFLKDLIEYLENKGIGYTIQCTKGNRSFEDIFGNESKELYGLIKALGKKNNRSGMYQIPLNSIEGDDKIKLYHSIRDYVDSLIANHKLKKLRNSIALDKVPVSLLLCDIEAEELIEWVNLITYLYKCEYVNLNGQSDISVKLHFQKGNYVKAPVSLFTYYRNSRVLEFREMR